MRKLITVLMVLLLAVSAQAFISKNVTGSEAESFVSIENHYLKVGESASADDLVLLGQDQYWLVTIKTGETPLAFVAVKDAAPPEIPESLAHNRNLFKTAYLLWSFRQTEDAFKRQNNWFFTLTNASSFRNLAQLLENEKTSLNIIKSDAVNSTITNKVNRLNSQLDSMALKASNIADDLTYMIEFYNNFTVNPATADLEEFEELYSLSSTSQSSLLFKVEALVDQATDYATKEVPELKNLIADSALDPGKKEQLIRTADAPFTLSSLTSLEATLTANKQGLDEVFLGLNSVVSNFVDEFEERKQMDAAYGKMYAESKTIKDVTQNQLTSLDQAIDHIMDSSRKAFWEEQGSVSQLEKNWADAERYYKQGNFENALANAQLAENAAKIIYAGGFTDVEPETADYSELIFYAAIGLIGLLALILIVKNKDKLGGFFASAEPKEEEYELEKFKKRW
jgi:hypothetical protein